MDILCKAVIKVWSLDNNRQHIDDIFLMCGFQDDKLVYKATLNLINSVHIELLYFNITGGLSKSYFNIFASSPINDMKMWMNLRDFLYILEYLRPQQLWNSHDAKHLSNLPLSRTFMWPMPIPANPGCNI